MNKITKNKSGERFSFGLFIVSLSITMTLFAFVSEENKITGLVTLENNQENKESIPLALIEFNDVSSLSTLAAGNYYVDSDGIIYWTDDNSKPAIAKVKFVDEIQKNRAIYIDDQGRIGYVLTQI